MVIFNKSNALRKLYKDRKPPFALLTAIGRPLHPVMVLVENGVLDGVYTKPICTSPANVIEYLNPRPDTHTFLATSSKRELPKLVS